MFVIAIHVVLVWIVAVVTAVVAVVPVHVVVWM